MSYESFQKKADDYLKTTTLCVYVPVSAPHLQLYTSFSTYPLLERKDLISNNLSLRQYSFRLLKSDIAASADN